MKNKKIIAAVVALASFLAMATSGLAAVTTSATYSGNNLAVTVDVEGMESTDEVTYLVKSIDAATGVSGNTDKIVYINQVTGNTDFNFVVDQAYVANGILSVTSNKIADTDVVVAPGTVTISKISVVNPSEAAKATTTYIKLTGNVNSFGVKYNNVEYPAVKVDGTTNETAAGIYAITLVGTDAAPATDAIEVYYK